jgi:hypothetical protein
LVTISLLANLKTMHGVSSVFMNELFSLLWKELLPKGNKMRTTLYEAFKLIKALSLSYDSIHACPNGCVLFWDTLKGSRVCPKCNINRFVDGSHGVPHKVLCHFHVIPRLLRVYRCKK